MSDTDTVLKLANKYKWIIGGLAAILMVPAAMILQNVIQLAIAGFVLLVTVQLAPALSFKLANWRLKIITQDIQENPIETMRNMYLINAQKIEDAETQIVEFDGEVRSFGVRVEKFKKVYPEDASTFVEVYDKMVKYRDEMLVEQRHAVKDLEFLDAQIEKANAIWEMTLAAQKVTELSGAAANKAFDHIKQTIALDSVTNRLNTTFAALDSALRKRSDATLAIEQLGSKSVGTLIDTKGKVNV